MPRLDNEVSQFGVQRHPYSVVNGCGVINGNVIKLVFEFTEIGWRQTITEKARVEEIGQTVCNGVPPLHDSLHKVNIKYEYSVSTNRIFS